MAETFGASRFQQVRARLEAFDPGSGWRLWIYEFLLFGFKQGWACLFGGLLLALLLATHFLYPDDAPLARYDFLTLAALSIQIAMLAFRLETWDEAKVILIFHVVGTVMEVFKTYAGSWVYPEPSLLRIAGVPLFSGFMYAAVGSYIARVWRIFDFRFAHYPPRSATWLLAVGVYANFFLHHYWLDLRWLLFGATALIFWRTSVHFRNFRVHRWMPLLLGFGLVALFIWFAENIGTFARAWSYPGQETGWKMVSLAKYGSWYLLMIISFVLVALVQPIRRPDKSSRGDAKPMAEAPARA
ncbi:DUF817 domain-containing protein [Alteriqipengyuania lutimaris]|uniref:DUF817 domain-containing protein n=1 Tax=Alteriqipengyuania lutimaris TaxID=1538146 RepID=A0A395LMX5_9SPHN|nr:DUF817 domain-containing protein [Alteriqipengyuania lutimaris]MBB3032916.1 uncharacterized membrane protein YoaT (DUF817 family) [Alteriqipengyuania lutimaris]RDS77999.1 DUF817 domain-containing protein [Alteriqipengyuania lutimaris]